ncbi:STAS domain-containing protein [Pseudonocardia kujensis]|uniref:STAS domain-containing protein n=1 Tax=Pseudonocardia kujensis TaxID=1128675 RepID=UPI001E429ACB|nr:STAS domain-containing protein [Pseudonocardia kujensis]MCE0764443.1 STAS domain-containing protein [Pseudonocardia kujensis]
MTSALPVQLCVEVPGTGTVLVRVAGDLDAGNGTRLLRLLDDLLRDSSALVTSAREETCRGRLVVDLRDVRSFECRGLDVLRHARHRAAAVGVELVVAGLEDRRPVLPGRVLALLDAVVAEGIGGCGSSGPAGSADTAGGRPRKRTPGRVPALTG